MDQDDGTVFVSVEHPKNAQVKFLNIQLATEFNKEKKCVADFWEI